METGGRRSRQSRINIGLGLAVSIFLVATLISFQSMNALSEGSDRVSDTRNILDRIEELISTLKDAETGQRGYIITGVEHFLKPYQAAIIRIDRIFETVGELTADNPRQKEKLDRLKPLIVTKMNSLKEGIDSRKSHGLNAAIELVMTGRGNNEMEAIRKLITEMKDEEMGRLGSRMERSKAQAQKTILVLWIDAILVLTIFFIVVYLLNREIMERRAAQGSLAKQTGILKSVLDSMGEGVIVSDLNGKFLIWNPAAEQIIQQGPKDVPWERWAEVYGIHQPDGVTPYHPARLPLLRAMRGESVDGDELLVRHPTSPQEVWLSVTGRPLRDESGTLRGGVIVFANTTKRKQAEEGLRRAEAFLNSIVENIPNMIFVKEARDLRFVRFNKAGEALLGYSREALLGKNDHDFFPKEQADFFTEKDRQVLKEGRLVDIPEEPIQIRNGEKRILHTQKIPLYDSDGKPLYLLGISEDITVQKEAEEALRLVNAQLETANKELEAFSYSVSHDLRAPLRHINGFVELLKGHQKDRLDEKGVHYMNTITNSAIRMGNLIDDLLVFSRMAKSEMCIEKVHFNRIISEVIRELGPETDGRKMAWKIGPLPPARGDSAMLRQVWANLIGNAVKYTRTRRQAEIEIGGKVEGKEHLFFIRDNGVGFDPQYVEKLFGVFQRLHRPDEFEGTGIGLASVRRIIHRHGGRIWAEGRLERGATFYFTLPNEEEKVG